MRCVLTQHPRRRALPALRAGAPPAPCWRESGTHRGLEREEVNNFSSCMVVSASGVFTTLRLSCPSNDFRSALAPFLHSYSLILYFFSPCPLLYHAPEWHCI
ncbi:unnamed protein product [Pleuronectes platessa]|uniref:Uncharacterized protein n=1 Tax=Pleuronectes platessa TaxID=8262 RepID=A0A9N7UFY8_PLEPL|nr:unnamed protein product [Pleuronectes platessa]